MRPQQTKTAAKLGIAVAAVAGLTALSLGVPAQGCGGLPVPDAGLTARTSALEVERRADGERHMPFYKPYRPTWSDEAAKEVEKLSFEELEKLATPTRALTAEGNDALASVSTYSCAAAIEVCAPQPGGATFYDASGADLGFFFFSQNVTPLHTRFTGITNNDMQCANAPSGQLPLLTSSSFSWSGMPQWLYVTCSYGHYFSQRVLVIPPGAECHQVAPGHFACGPSSYFATSEVGVDAPPVDPE